MIATTIACRWVEWPERRPHATRNADPAARTGVARGELWRKPSGERDGCFFPTVGATSIGNLIKLINKYYLGFMTSYSSWRPNIGPVEMSNPVRPPSTILWALATTLALL